MMEDVILDNTDDTKTELSVGANCSVKNCGKFFDFSRDKDGRFIHWVSKKDKDGGFSRKSSKHRACFNADVRKKYSNKHKNSPQKETNIPGLSQLELIKQLERFKSIKPNMKIAEIESLHNSMLLCIRSASKKKQPTERREQLAKSARIGILAGFDQLFRQNLCSYYNKNKRFDAHIKTGPFKISLERLNCHELYNDMSVNGGNCVWVFSNENQQKSSCEKSDKENGFTNYIEILLENNIEPSDDALELYFETLKTSTVISFINEQEKIIKLYRKMLNVQEYIKKI